MKIRLRQNYTVLSCASGEGRAPYGPITWTASEIGQIIGYYFEWRDTEPAQFHFLTVGGYLVYIRVMLTNYNTTDSSLTVSLHLSTDNGNNFGTSEYNLFLSDKVPVYAITVMITTGMGNPWGITGSYPSPVRMRLEASNRKNVTKFHTYMRVDYMGDVIT